MVALVLFSALRFVLIGLLVMLSPIATMADTIIMTTGETFSSPNVWEQDGKIHFSMHGLMVGVAKSDVAQIIRNQDKGQPTRQPAPPRHQALVAPLPPHPLEPTVQTRPLTREPSYSLRPVKPSRRHHRDQTAAPSTPGGIGLNGVSWQMTLSDLTNVKKIETDPMYGGIDQYYRENETMTLGPAVLDGKVYGFWHNRLYLITMWVEGLSAYKRLRKAVFERYGPGTQNSNGRERYIWTDPTTDRLLEFDVPLNTGVFWMRSRALDEKLKQLYGN